MEGPVRFQCPPEFEAVAGLGGGTLGGPDPQLWLIRAPADFCPESLEGCQVPLAGCGQLRPPQEGDGRCYRLRGGPGGDSPPPLLLLAPTTPSGPLACAPPLRGCLTISESFGPPPGPPLPEERKRRKKKAAMKEAPELPEVTTPGRAASDEGGECGLAPPPDAGVTPEQPKRKKKKKKMTKELPEVATPEPAAPNEGGEQGLGPPPDVEVTPEVPKRKKKKMKERPG